MKKAFYITFLISFYSQFLIAQNGFPLNLNWSETPPKSILENLEIQSIYPDSFQMATALKKLIFQLQNNAFIASSVDSLIQKDSIFTAHIFLGKPYEWANLKNGNIENAFLSQIGFREKVYQNKPFNYLKIRELQETLLEYAENNGYPFASVWLDSVKVNDGKVEAQIFMHKGRLVFFEAIKIEGDAKISEAYLQNYLGLKVGSLYSKSKILKIRNRLQELPFLKTTQNPTITFTKNKATVNLFLEKKKASRFDFLLGFLPGGQANTTPNAEDSKLLITGTANAEMHNQFGLGEKIFVAFERLRPETQELELEFSYPYILQMPFGLDLKFNQYKRDTTYSDVIFDAGFQYLFEGGNYLKAFWNNAASNVLTVDTIQIKNGNSPNNLDVVNTSYGLELGWQKLDYRFNPRKGWNVVLRGGAGFKKIEENNKILEVAENFYDTLNLRSFQFKLNSKIERYFPIAKNATIKTQISGGAIFSENPIYQNEQFRIGGNQLLRGFDEESIFSTLYAVLTVEARLLVGQNSYFYVFGDAGYVEDKTTKTRDFDKPYGMGLGMTFETTVGVFGLSLAVGSQQGNKVDFRNPKVHFGYVSYF